MRSLELESDKCKQLLFVLFFAVVYFIVALLSKIIETDAT